MKTFVGPRTVLERDDVVMAAARALAGPGGSVQSLRDLGVANLTRPLSAAEVALLREAMGGCLSAGEAAETCKDEVGVGYVCRGALMGGLAGSAADSAARVVVVTDHANLTWRSPLTGPNDDRVGPRFPSMTGVYAPETALNRLRALDGMIVATGVMAGVFDDEHLSAFESDVAVAQGHVAASSELAPVVIVAAHMGLRVAAAVVVAGSQAKGDG